MENHYNNDLLIYKLPFPKLTKVRVLCIGYDLKKNVKNDFFICLT